VNNRVPRYTGLLLLALAAVLLFGCTSAEELVEEGQKLETQGLYEQAAYKYIAAYEKDPSVPNLRLMVMDLGNLVVSEHIDEGERAFREGRFVNAAESYVAVDELVLRAFEVGIQLDRPENYSDRRNRIMRRAISDLLEEGRALYETGRLEQADRVFRRALDDFDPSFKESQRLLVGRFNVLVAMADRSTGAGHYREAVNWADQAMAIAMDAGIGSGPAAAARARAIELGTLYVAATPMRSWNRQRGGASGWVLGEMNDRLELEYWSDPPPMIAMAHGALVRQRMRHLGLGRRALNRLDARALAFELNADLVVLLEAERFNWTEDKVRRRPRTARTHSGETVSYDEIESRIEYRAVVRLAIVRRDGSLIFDDHVDEKRHRDFTRAEYDGDVRELDISGGKRKLFREDRFDDFLADLEEELVERITDRVAHRTFDRLRAELR
jgi:tetratricopeptide (TPR) repeat protein